MRRTAKVLFLAVLLTLLAQTSGAENPSVTDAINKGSSFLWSQQSADGAWRSSTYGLLRSGQALTPFVLNTLSQIDSTSPNKERAAAAVTFIKQHLAENGALGMADNKLHDYPNYSSSQALLALSKLGETETAAKLAAFLRTQQFTGDDWPDTHPAFGAWGMGGIARTPREPGHLDLSMTRHVLEALRSHDPASHAQALNDAQIFLGRCQNFSANEPGSAHDGGFFFSTVVSEANKAGASSSRFLSYGTATADGILSLLACGVPENDPRIKAAFNWLIEHPAIETCPGFPKDSSKRWDTGLKFYYYAAAAKVFRKLSPKDNVAAQNFRTNLIAHLLKTQRPDGSWLNDNFLVKEDDPLIATAFALSALAELTH